MTVKVWCAIVATTVAIGVVGCKKQSPLAPQQNPPSTTPPPAPTPPLPISTVGPYIAQTINSVVEQALRQGLTQTGSARWTSNCPADGNVRIELSTDYRVGAGNAITLNDTGIVFTDCAIETNVATLGASVRRLLDIFIEPLYAAGRPTIVAKGRLRGKGKWRPPIQASSGPRYLDAPVRMTGSLEVNQINCGDAPCPTQIGEIRIECGINGTVCEGEVGVIIGPKDTPPTPNPPTPPPPPPTEPPPTNPPPTQPPPTQPPTDPPGALNVTGTWTVTDLGGSGAGNAVLVQSGTAVSGSAVIPPVPGASITTNRFTGTVSGGVVTLTHQLSVTTAAGGITTVCTSTVNYTLQATSTRMSGPYSGTGRCTHNIPEVPQPPSTTVSGSSVWTKS